MSIVNCGYKQNNIKYYLMSNQTKKGPGRPKGSVIDNPASVTLPRVRVTPGKLAEYKQSAGKSGKTFSQWARDSLDKTSQKS